MQVKFSKPFLTKLENLISETDYSLRYEKGNFKAGYCILNEQKIIIVNKYFSLEGKINSLIELISNIDFSKYDISKSNMELIFSIQQKEIKF